LVYTYMLPSNHIPSAAFSMCERHFGNDQVTNNIFIQVCPTFFFHF
jgi:hypothetical protein